MAITCDLVTSAVAEYYTVPKEELLSARRSKAIIPARQAAYWLARHLTGSSYQEIALYMGGRDHTTVLHGVREVDQLLVHDLTLKAKLHELETIIRAVELTLSRVGVEQARDIDPVSVASRLLHDPLGRLHISVDELKMLARAVINQSAALDDLNLQFADSVDQNTQTARMMRETFVAFEQWKSGLYTSGERASNSNLERHLSALKARFEHKETRT